MRMRIESFRPDGTRMDLLNPLPTDVNFCEIANGLSKIARWNGRNPGPAFSVAQHCVMGADALMAETGDTRLAACFLLHDAHEAFIGDITTPTATAIDWLASGASGRVLSAIDELKRLLDVVIFHRAGVFPFWESLEMADAVKRMDRRMAFAEACALFGQQAAEAWPMFVRMALEERGPPKTTGSFRPWAPMKAEEQWLDRLRKFAGLDARAAA